MGFTVKQLDFVIHHIIFPPKRPQQEESEANGNGKALLCLILDAAQKYKAFSSPRWQAKWSAVVRALQACAKIQDDKRVGKDELIKAIGRMRLGDWLAIHVSAQNAGLIIRDDGVSLIFESFEVSPQATAVMGAKGSLLRCFPGRAVAIPTTTAKDPLFLEQLAAALEQLSIEQVAAVMPTARKAGETTVEDRDTAHPKLVTDMLMSLFAAVGEPVQPVTIQKRIRDDVCLSNAKLPWWRSGLWLVLRVALQRALVLGADDDLGRDQYKNFMIFLISKVGELTLEAKLPSDILSIVNAKLGRRMLKLEQRVEEFVVRDALEVSQRLRGRVESDWHDIRTLDDEGRVVPRIQTDKAPADTALSMRNSRSYLTNALHPSYAPSGKQGFSPPAQSRLTLEGNMLPELDNANLGSPDAYFRMADFERWVEQYLHTWADETFPSADECTKLANLIAVYSSAALSMYDRNPLHMSSALLVILELWQALDKFAVNLIPLLGEYTPDIPVDFLHPLLLPKLAMMKRLNTLEEYLTRRYGNASQHYPSVFADIAAGSFSVRFFDTSDEHENLYLRIVRDATQKKQQKFREWQDSDQRYDSLTQQEAGLVCEEKWINRRGWNYHDQNKCERCKVLRAKKNLTIKVYEWPLPKDDSQCKAAVFELKCPPAFRAWRDATYHIINDLGRASPVSGPKAERILRKYEALKEYHTHPTSRITLASTNKSFEYQSHYKLRSFPVSLDEILLNNGLHYLIYDDKKDNWVADQIGSPNIRSKCVATLPAGPYSTLQYAVNSTVHTTNYVLANQGDCPAEISVNEYLAFGSLRAGNRVQWLNIMRELASSDLTFRDEAVTTLILQAAWQAGQASGSVLRDAHVHFEDQEFCRRLLDVIERMLRSIEANWKEDHSMSTLIALTLRTLTLASRTPGIADEVMKLLRQMRGVTLGWARQLVDQLHGITEDGQIPATQRRLVNIACLCRMTYDVDPEFLDSMLKDDDDLAHFVECAILIRDNCSSDVGYHSPQDKIRLLRDKKLAHALEGPVRQFITLRRNGLDQAIKRIWSGYSVGEPWKILPPPTDQWVTTWTSSGAYQPVQKVHYNILEGELLIDGRPLGRLPHEYTRHKTFHRIFGTRVLNVSQPNMEGMLYMTAKEVAGYQVYFRMKDNGELIIKTKRESEILELIPHHHLIGDLPVAFVDEHVHWLNPQTGVIELRPLTTLWEQSPKNWQMHLSEPSQWSMKLGRKQLIDIRSRTASAIANVLKPLEEIGHLHATLRDDGVVEVELPRYKLHFSVNEAGLLESSELAATVDDNQSIGTMYGLQNRLVLRSNETLGAGVSWRSVLIPYGSVSVRKAPTGHVCVSITPSVKRIIKYFRYEIDSKLGRLKGFSTLRGRLYRAYLHAVTSHILPDPLTKRTGTEEALDYLRSASSMPLDPLDEEMAALLEEIAALTPKRLFYKHLKSMQTIEWNEHLSPLAQHDDFVILAEGLVAHSNGLAVLYEGAEKRVLTSRGAPHLLQRARLRNSVSRPKQLGEDMTDVCDDHKYEGRDRESVSNSGHKVYEIASLIRDWPSKVNTTTDLWDILRGWRCISGYGEPMGVRVYTDLLRLPLHLSWGSLYDLCRRTTRQSGTFTLMFLFGTLAFGEAQMVPLRTLLATAFHREFCNLVPADEDYTLDQGYEPVRYQLIKLTNVCAESFHDSAESLLPRNHNRESDTDLAHRRRQAFDDVLERHTAQLVDHVVSQWPCETPSMPFIDDCHIDLDDASATITCMFAVWYKNWRFRNHILEVQRILDSLGQAQPPPQHLDFPTAQLAEQLVPEAQRTSITWRHLLQDAALELLPTLPTVFTAERELIFPRQNAEHEKLSSMVKELWESGNEIRSRYGLDLARSLDSLQTSSDYQVPLNLPCTIEQLKQEHSSWKTLTDEIFMKLCTSLHPRTDVEKSARLGGHWPSVTPLVLLKLLSTSWVETLSKYWRCAIVLYGKAICMYQRSERLLTLAQRNDLVSFYKEAENPGHGLWSPEQYPDWLLMEIDNDFLIRPVQVEVALEMINPSSRSNSVMQLNMGEGKSSVIIPMVAAALADGSKLARVIVLKSLSRQMAGLLSGRLGGLVNRRTYSIPFSRQTTLDATVAYNLQQMYEKCRDGRGVLLVQPEHMLSFKLIGIERLSSGALPLASKLLDSQRWLEENSRDILDESDEILDVRFQLIYTIGTSKLIEGHPNRWLTIQKVFDLVARHSSALQQAHPSDFEVLRKTPGSFPTLCFLGKSDVPQLLLERVVGDIGKGALPEALFEKCPEAVRNAALKFISSLDIGASDLSLVTQYFPGHGTEMATLLLLRGLLAHQILLFSLQKKRWMVSYGLDSNRKPACLMAVPYRAKGVPSLNAEFGHPDVAICLTCLSYYYDGLTDDQLRQCFSILYKTDDPTLEYTQWENASHTLPSNLRQLGGVNLEDDQQFSTDLFPHFRYTKPVIDFFMSHVVFPRECKEFEKKLTTSGWDIPSEMKGVSLTTGFSGTNDSQYLLPCSIKQQDLPDLQATSARVLSYVLQPENQHYVCAKNPKTGDRLGVSDLLKLVADQTPPIRVLLDVGAQILELNNRELASEWLYLVPDVDAAIYFDESDELVVIDREGNTDLLFTSPYRSQLGRCLVYLDDVHTRGTDLKLPTKTRAAVTLGPSLTKDRLVQACMRMRKLGHGQSLLFLAPPEVDQSILEVLERPSSGFVTGTDVVKWALEQTCRSTETSQALWVNQGLSYQCRKEAHRKFSGRVKEGGSLDSDSDATRDLLHVLEEPDARTLHSLYGADPAVQPAYIKPETESPEDSKDPDVEEINRVAKSLSHRLLKNSTMEEEQERELAHEKEVERQVQRPAKLAALNPCVHVDVWRFVREGILPPVTGSGAFLEAFSMFHNTSASQFLQPATWATPNLLVTTNFMRTVEIPLSSPQDEYLQSVHWVLTSNSNSNGDQIDGNEKRLLVVISAFEANELLPLIRQSKAVTLHVYTPNVAKAMQFFDDLTFYSISASRSSLSTWRIPTATRRMLNIFAGQLYLRSYDDYHDLCEFLSPQISSSKKKKKKNKKKRERSETLAKAFLNTILGMRRRGQGFRKTDLGKVVAGKVVDKTEFSVKE